MRSVAATLTFMVISCVAAVLAAAEPMIEPLTFCKPEKHAEKPAATIVPPIDVKLEDVRWQVLPEQITSVVVSPDQRAWFIVGKPNQPPILLPWQVREVVEREFAKPSPQLQGVQAVFFEAQGVAGEERKKLKRVWVLCQEARARDLLLGYDGKQWIERRAKTDYFMRELWTSLAFHQMENGIALMDYHGCHVLQGDRWIYQNFQSADPKYRTSLTESRIWPDTDGKGLIVLAAPGYVTLWRYREGTWQLLLPEKKDGALNARNCARLGDHLYVHTGSSLRPRVPGGISARDAALLRRALPISVIQRIGLDGKVDELTGDDPLAVGPYRVPLKCAMHNDPAGNFYAVSDEIFEGTRRLGSGAVTCNVAGKITYVPVSEPRALNLFQLPQIRVFTNGGTRAWRDLNPAARWNMETLTPVDQLADADFQVLAAMDDGTAFAGCPTRKMPGEYGPLIVYRSAAPEPRTALAGQTLKIHGPGFCIASDGCVWAPTGEFGLERFDGKKWHSCARLIKGAESLRLAPYSLIPGQNGWVLTYIGHRVSDLEIGKGVIYKTVFGPQYFLVNTEKCWGGSSFGPWVSKHREEFLEAFSQPCANRPWYSRRPMVARPEGPGTIVTSPLDVSGDKVVVDKDKNIWVNSLGVVSVISGTRVIDVSIPGGYRALAERQGCVADIALLGDGQFVFLRLGSVTFFARLKPGGDVEFVDGPKIAHDEPEHPVGILRDREGGLWVTLRRRGDGVFEGGRLKGVIACRLTAPDKGRDFREVGEAKLVDASGCVWLAPIEGLGGDLVSIWAPNGETSTLKIPGRRAGAFLAAGPKGVVYAQTAFGVRECVAKDPAKPNQYTLGTTYHLESASGEALKRLQYSSLGYLVATGFQQNVEDSLRLHLYPLDQSLVKRAEEAAASHSDSQGAATAPAEPGPRTKASAKLRTWTDATGEFSVEAEFISAGEGRSRFASPTARLSRCRWKGLAMKTNNTSENAADR
jgi:hypothetical protein